MFADTAIAMDILRKRYYRDGESSPRELLSRVAAAVAKPEKDFNKWSGEFYNVMSSGTFLPNSPCLVNAGHDGGLFACFVIGIEDSLDSISLAKAQAMAITKSGGGWGIGLSALRPVGSNVTGSTHGIAGGPIGFLSTFSADMKVMTQGGFRDAACMATMSVDHPDIIEFIEAKSPENSIIEMLNLYKVTPTPLKSAVELLKDATIVSAAETYLSNFNMSILATDDFMDKALAGPGVNYTTRFDGNDYEVFDASIMLRQIAEKAWGNGEPGLLFIDTIKNRTKYDPDSISATNPCGEQPLPPNGSCCLGSINVSNLVNSDEEFDFDRLRGVVRIAVRFLDNMITINSFPTLETRDWALKNRSIGIGVMGFADALIKMNIRYDSPAATDLASIVASLIRNEAEAASRLLFEEKGTPACKNFDGRRNNAVMSIAPTGTLSLLAGCSPGIEPIFSKNIIRIDETGKHFISHPLAGELAFVTVKDINWGAIIDIVAAFSEHVDTSVSYTVNLPNDATIEDVINAYAYAWRLGCNGCTVYRDQSRNRQVLNTTASEVASVSDLRTKRPWALNGVTYKYPGRVGDASTSLYVTVNDKDKAPFEVFVSTPYIISLTELQLVSAVTRLTSLALKYGAPVKRIIKQLKRVEGQSVTSIPLLISRALEEHTDAPTGDCQECGGELIRQGGCTICQVCGHSHCG